MASKAKRKASCPECKRVVGIDAARGGFTATSRDPTVTAAQGPVKSPTTTGSMGSRFPSVPDSTKTPVKNGQWREYGHQIYAVLNAHPRRKGFWIVVSSRFPYHVSTIGRKELENLPLCKNKSYFGEGVEHPGLRYQESLLKAFSGESND